MFGHMDAHGELLFQFVNVGNNDDKRKFVFDHVNGFDQVFAALSVLGAEALVNKQGLQGGASAAGAPAPNRPGWAFCTTGRRALAAVSPRR
jgi:hypothetical protein